MLNLEKDPNNSECDIDHVTLFFKAVCGRSILVTV